MRAAEAARISALEAELAAAREQNCRLEAQLRNLADNDPLTDLLNRRSMEQELEQHIARCTRYGAEGAFLLVALDGLEAVAAASGQVTADEVVAAVGERVVARLRNTDVVGRWSEAELAVLLPKVSVDHLAVVAEALAEIVDRTGTGRVPPGSLTASIGVALVVAARLGPAERAAGAVIDARRQGGGWAVAGR